MLEYLGCLGGSSFKECSGCVLQTARSLLRARRAPACCRLGQRDAGFPLLCCLGLVPSEGEEMGQHLSRRHPLEAEPSPCKVSSNFSAAKGHCQSSSWNSPALLCCLCQQPPGQGERHQPGHGVFLCLPPTNTFTLSTHCMLPCCVPHLLSTLLHASFKSHNIIGHKIFT